MDKIKNSKVVKGLLVGSALTGVSAACVNKAPVVEAAPLPSVDEKSTPSIEEAPIETLLPIATLAPTETEDPFEGLNICRTWQEAENCPITVADFERLPDFVKANFTFPSEAMKVSWLEIVPVEGLTDFVRIHALTKEEIINGTSVVATESVKNTEKEYVYTSSLSPIGKPYFFLLTENSSTNNYDCWVAVFPVNNADGSVGTYTIIVPPYVFKDHYETPEDRTEVSLREKFDKLPYLPPAYFMGVVSSGVLNIDKQGSFIKEIHEDTNDPNGERRKLFDEWNETAIIPEELEKLPLFGSDLDLVGRTQELG